MAKELTVQEQRELLANPIIQEVKKFEMQQRMAQMYTTSSILPATFRGNIGNIVIAIDMAQRMQCNPLLVMQNLYVVNGNPAWSARFMVACVNQCGRFTPLDYEVVGDDPFKKSFKVRALAYERHDVKKERPLYGAWITWAMVDGEGWSKKSGSKWLTMPEQMFRYRAASYWAKVFAPEISMGFPTAEEVADGVTDVDFDEVIDYTPEPHVDPEVAPHTDPDEPVHGDPEPMQPNKDKAEEKPSPQQAIQDAIKAKVEKAVPAKDQTLFNQEQ